MTMSLEKEFEFYKANQDQLVRQYEGKYIVIVNESVVGDYDTEIEAYEASKQDYAPGSFLIQKCLPGNESYTQTFHSRVVFH